MKKIFTRILAAAIGCVSALSLVGCRKEEKKIIIALPMGDERPVWDALAADYMSMHPDVTVEVTDKDSASYQDWLLNCFSSYSARSDDLPADIVTVNLFQNYINDNKFLNLDTYLNSVSPYIGSEEEPLRWKDGMEKDAYINSLDNKFVGDGSTYCISLDWVQVAIFYNKKIFEMCNVQPPKTWDELVEVCEKISTYNHPETSLPFAPLSIPGDSTALYYYFNWLLRIYSDQYFRDLEPTVVSQPGDYMHDGESGWVFDINDLENDKSEDIQFNLIRFASEVYNGGDMSVISGRYAEMLENLAKVFPQYALPDFFSTGLGYEYYYFMNAQSAMLLDMSQFTTAFDYYMDRPYQKGFKEFEYGIFYLPPMGVDYDEATDTYVKQAGSKVGVNYARSLGGAVGYHGAINKSKEQNDLNADFLMYYSSPRGQKVRFDAMEENKINATGKVLVKDFTLSDELNAKFDELEYRGECDYNIATAFSLGWMGDQVSVRDVKTSLTEFLKGNKDVTTTVGEVHGSLKLAIERWIDKNGYKSDCLSNPSANPNK